MDFLSFVASGNLRDDPAALDKLAVMATIILEGWR